MMKNNNNIQQQIYYGNKLRKGRQSIENQIYLITTVTHQRILLFADLRLGRVIVNAMNFQHEKEFINSLSFVVMPDHVHWLFQLNEKTTLPSIVRQFKTFTSFKIYFIMETNRKTIWQAGYHDHALRKEEDIKNIAKYIVANPLRAGLVTDIGEYSLWDAVWL